MDRIMQYLDENWQFTIIGLGILILIGAIFNINFIIDRQGARPMSILSLFGDKGYRIILGITGVCVIVFGVVSLL